MPKKGLERKTTVLGLDLCQHPLIVDKAKWTVALEQASTSALARGSNSFNVCHFKCAPHQILQAN